MSWLDTGTGAVRYVSDSVACGQLSWILSACYKLAMCHGSLGSARSFHTSFEYLRVLLDGQVKFGRHRNSLPNTSLVIGVNSCTTEDISLIVIPFKFIK